MDARPPRQPDDDPFQPFPPDAFDPVPAGGAVRIDDSGDLAASLPVLVGFRPRESLVLIALGGDSGRRVGLTARVDIPVPRHARPIAEALARRLRHEGPDAAVLAVVSDDPDVSTPADEAGDLFAQHVDLPHRALVHELVIALEAHGIPLQEALLVRDGRWWSYDCPELCCSPGAGTRVASGTSALEAASVAAGQVVASDRAELALRIAPTGPAEVVAMAGTLITVGEELTDVVLRHGRDAAADRYAEWVDTAVARCAPSGAGTRLTDEDVARVAWGLRDVRVRDRALGFALGPDAAAAEQLWTECTRRAPEPLDAAPATLLAVSAWLRGDGAMARIALDRALHSQPDYALADLLVRGMDAGLGPRELRAMVAATQADLGFPLGLPDGALEDPVLEMLRAPSDAESAAAAEQVRAGRGAATPPRGRARRGRRSPSRTRRPRSPE
jgi:hypothetical protein